MTNQTLVSSLSSVSFLNIFGIFVSIVLCILFLIMSGHAIKYIKAYAVKIKVIANRAKDRNIHLKEYNYKPPSALNSEIYDEMEAIFKNQIKKSRSLNFNNILRSYMASYDHIVFFPFRNRVEEYYDLLRPKLSFYNMLILTSCTIAWMVTVFLASLLSATYSNIATIQMGVFIGVTIVIAMISSILNWVAINRLLDMYVMNVKGAFKVYYDHTFVPHGEGEQLEYIPEDQEEEDLLFGTGPKQITPNYEEDFKTPGGPTIQIDEVEESVKNEDMIASTRQLIGQEIEKSDVNMADQSGVPNDVS